MSITDDVDNAVELAFDKGVAHENARITQAVAQPIVELRNWFGTACNPAIARILDQLDAATRAPGTKRRKR